MTAWSALAGARTEPEVLAAFASDASGIPAGSAGAVLSPTSIVEVQEAVRFAHRHRVPVVPRGAGTGLAGGAAAVDGCLLLDMTKLDAFIELDAAARLAVVQPGVVNARVSAEARPHGLMFAPDPASWESSTIGGNIATNAGGLRCLRYGTTRDSILGLSVVLADGRLLRTGGRTVKRSAGYDLTQLFIGSEGTLGVIVEATIRLQPLPSPQITALLTYNSVAAAVADVKKIARKCTPTMLELLDGGAVAAVDAARGTGFGADVRALLLVQVEDRPGNEVLLQDMAPASDAFPFAVTRDLTEATALVELRRSVLPALQQGRLILEDVCVPLPSLDTMIDAAHRHAAAAGVIIATVAHAGDGNLHPAIVVPPDAEARAWQAAEAIFRTAIDLGGTVSASTASEG